MPRFLRIGNEMIHVPSLSSVSIRTSCFGVLLITLSYHATKNVLHLRYSNWDSCQRDFNQIKNALNEIEDLLNKVPLTEPEARLLAREQSLLQPDLQEVNTIVEKKMVELKESIDTMVLHLRYSSWDSCQKDFNKIKNALNEIEDLLNKVPLTEPEARLLVREQSLLQPDLQEVNTIVEKKMVELKESIDTMDVLVKEGIKSTEATISPT